MFTALEEEIHETILAEIQAEAEGDLVLAAACADHLIELYERLDD